MPKSPEPPAVGAVSFAFAAHVAVRWWLGFFRKPEGGSMEAERTKRLDEQDHRSLALWAADCAEHVVPFFEKNHPQDDRPRKAIEAARAWVRGEIACGEARAAATAAHAAARAVDEGPARAVARAAGHAAATAHMAAHARHAAAYAVKAATAAGTASATERDWQWRRLPDHLRPAAFSPSRR
jgi:hypothetical protein